MDKTAQINKSIQWYFHPYESMRLLRYFQHNMKFDVSVNYQPNYSNNISVGVVFNIPEEMDINQLELQLHYIKKINLIEKIFIHDNYTKYSKLVLELAEKYNCTYFTPEKKQFNQPHVGSIDETSAIYNGLIWAKENNLDILVKLDIDLIPCFNWKCSLIELAKNSDGIIFSSYCEKRTEFFRTDCIGFYVPAWTKNYPMQCFQFTLENELPVHHSIWLHELAKTLSYNNFSNKWETYIKENKIDYLHSGYVLWKDILGINKYSIEHRNSSVLQNTYSSESEYKQKMEEVFGK